MRVWRSVPLRCTLCMITGLLAAIAMGCRDTDADLTGSAPGLTGPTVFVQVGILKYPQGIAVDGTGDIWVSDTNGDRITRFTPAGSQRLSLGGVTTPTFMGFDRATNDILVVSQNEVLRINPQNETVTTIAAVSGAGVDAVSTFNVRTGQIQSRTLSIRQLGDIDGTPGGDVYLSSVTTDGQNYLLRIRTGQISAVAFSDIPPDASPNGATRFVCSGALGEIFTAFVFQSQQQPAVARSYVVLPSNITSSRVLGTGPVSDGARGAGIDGLGNLYIADSQMRQLILISIAPERVIDVLDIPAVAGMTDAAPWDVAVGTDGSVYVTVVDLFDTSRQLGGVLKYSRAR